MSFAEENNNNFFNKKNICFSGVKTIDLSNMYSLLFYYFDSEYYIKFFKMVANELSLENKIQVMDNFLHYYFNIRYGGDIKWTLNIIKKNNLENYTSGLYHIVSKNSLLIDNKRCIEETLEVYPCLKNYIHEVYLFSKDKNVLDYILSLFEDLKDFENFKLKATNLVKSDEIKLEKINKKYIELENKYISNGIIINNKKNNKKRI